MTSATRRNKLANPITLAFAIACAAMAMTACARTPQEALEDAVGQSSSNEPAVPAMVVHKSPYCGCCKLWVEHMRDAGFAVEVREAENLHPVKQRLGVPYGKGSCHTAEVGGYFIEGHVPAEDVRRLISERPDARGLAVPGMPKGSPGMEMPDGSTDPYTVELVADDGTSTPFARH